MLWIFPNNVVTTTQTGLQKFFLPSKSWRTPITWRVTQDLQNQDPYYKIKILLQNQDPLLQNQDPLLQNQDPRLQNQDYKTKTDKTKTSIPAPIDIHVVPTFMFSDFSLHSGFISFCVASLICIEPARYRNYLEMIQPLILQ
jgi:hypothetical protein